MDEFVGQKIKDALTKGTELPVSAKADVWANVKQAVDSGSQEATVLPVVRKKRFRYWAYTAVAASVLLLTLAGFTPEGQAAAKKIKQILLPQKQIIEEIEGQTEKTKVSLEQSSIGYAIYFDKDRYQMLQEDGKDKIVPRLSSTEKLPKVFMEIYQIKDKDPLTVLEQLRLQLKAQYPEVNYIGKVEQPLPSRLITAKSGNKWNSTVERYFLIDNTLQGTFVVRQHFFLEAEEGHGARFDHMLSEFRLVTPDKK